MRPADEDGALVSVLLMTTVLALLVGAGVLARAALVEPGVAFAMAGGALFLAGVVCVVSYFIPHKAMLFRGVMYVCTHTNLVFGRWTVFMTAALFFLLSALLFRHGLGLG